MKRTLLYLIPVCLLMASCLNQSANPFFTEWKTPHQTPPFDQIKEKHYLPAFQEGIRQQQTEIESIVTSAEAPTFKNTIETLENSGKMLTMVDRVFTAMVQAMTNEYMQEIAKEVAPLKSKNRDDINLNEKLFQRVKTVYLQKDGWNLNDEQKMLLEKIYKDFVRGGADLDEEKKTRLREINKELSVLSVQFDENILKENNTFELVVENKENLSGLPDAAISGAEEAATERGNDGEWVFTLHKPSMIPFLQYSDKRELREKIFKAYINRGNNDNELDNKKIVSRMAALRVQKARLLGYETHADFVLEESMAKEPGNVYKLLKQLWTPALKLAKKETRALQAMIDADGHNYELKPWDWWYYAEKVKKAQYDLDEEMLRPYFQLDNVRDGAFAVANKLWGLEFVARTDISGYHEDVKVFEVREADGSHIGILYTDYFPRASKGGGAWMDAFRKQSGSKGEDVTPVIYNVGNFSKPTGDKPALLSWDEVMTLFHEFGHALHGLLSECHYEKLSGTEVSRDFVEMPSTIMENWAGDPEVLKMYAKHYETGETIPKKLIDKVKKSGRFNMGFITVEYLSAAFLDMDWHTLTDSRELAPIEFENKAMKKIGLIPEIVVRYRSMYFAHIFAGGYSSGYYSYIWSEVLDADAFQAFKETGLFDQKTAQAFRSYILSRGGTEESMALYKRFRGREPDIKALLKRRGLQ
jgi:peptidyl-dipeptidase Dcp